MAVMTPPDAPSQDDHRAYLVRPATLADQGAIEDVRRRTWHAAYDHLWGPELIERYFAGRVDLRGAPRSAGWAARPWSLVAEHEGEVAGLARAGMLTSGVGELVMLYVAPEHQGRGAGVKLWDEVVRRLRAAGCHELQLWVLSRNTRARRFYERRGCRPFVTSPVYLGARTEEETGYRLPLR